MKPQSFNYFRPNCIDEALELLDKHSGSAKVLAGGQSLVPLMNQRSITCKALIDVNRIEILAGIGLVDNQLRIGAMTRQADLENNRHVLENFPEISKLLPYLGFPAVRNRGTVGGSLAWADPTAELPALALALDGKIERQSKTGGSRTIPVDDFLTGPFQNSSDPNELVTALSLPLRKPLPRYFVREVNVRALGRATAGIIATVHKNQAPQATLFGWAERPIKSELIIPAKGNAASQDEWLAPFELRTDKALWVDDAHGTADYRRFVLASLLRNAAQHFGQF